MLRAAGFTPGQLKNSYAIMQSALPDAFLAQNRVAVEHYLFGRGLLEFLGDAPYRTPHPNQLERVKPTYTDENGRHYYPACVDESESLLMPAVSTDTWFFVVPRANVIAYRAGGMDVPTPSLSTSVDLVTSMEVLWLRATESAFNAEVSVQSVLERREASGLIRLSSALPVMRIGLHDAQTLAAALQQIQEADAQPA